MSKKKIETDEQPQTMEEYLLSQLDTPAYLKDGTIATVNGKELTKQEAIATNILNLAMKGDVVIDPCAGSGTTLRAAMQTFRRAYGFEIKKDFYKLANEKILKEYQPKLF